MKQKPIIPAYSLRQDAADMIYKFANQIGCPLVHYDQDKIKMLEEALDNARSAAINITYHLHQMDKERYKWTDGERQ